jgi:ABC-type multidrug transport system ATPase subunit
VLNGTDLTVDPGTRLALVGPNGAGKSTLLRVIAGLLRPASGIVQIDGRSIADDPWHARRTVGLVGHQPMLYPELTSRENLTFYARLYGLDGAEERVAAALTRVDLSRRAGDRVGTLSRGMLQRLALARALLHEPAILLLDEAESGLDAHAHELLIAALGAGPERRTVLLASHDLGYVCEVAEAVAFLHRGRVAEVVQTAGLTIAALQDRYAEVLARRPARRDTVIIGGGGARPS